MRPAAVSATNTSPFGAVRSSRGASSPSAKSVTLNPGGACGTAPGGRGTTSGALLAERVA